VPPLTHTYDLCIAGCRAKKAKTILASLAASPNNQELRRLTDAGVVPDWFPGIQEVWKHAMNHISHLDLAAQELPRRFLLPPIHLFWGGEPQNQCIYYCHRSARTPLGTHANGEDSGLEESRKAICT
jgi:hypothetical protein